VLDPHANGDPSQPILAGDRTAAGDRLKLAFATIFVLAYPFAYHVLSTAPWSTAFFEAGDRSAFGAVIGSIMTLHVIGVGFALVLARSIGITREQLRVEASTQQLIRLSGVVLLVGSAIVLMRLVVPYGDGVPRIPVIPQTTGERLWMVVAALSAGLCEEFTYRCFGTAVFERWGLPKLIAVFIPTVAWVFIHGALPLPIFIGYAAIGCGFAWLWLRRGYRVVVGTHASVNLLSMFAP
jgi:hypothetical protein